MPQVKEDFYPLTSIQQQLVDKLSNAPLAGGTIEFFRNSARSTPKNYYTINTGTGPNWTFTERTATITLSSIGTLDDGAGNNIVPYLYPYDGVSTVLPRGDLDYYYIVVKNSDGQLQFNVEGTPSINDQSVTPVATTNLENFIINGQFPLHIDIAALGLITAAVTDIAYGGWRYIMETAGTPTVDHVTFEEFKPSLDISTTPVTGNPRYSVKIDCTSPGTDNYKYIEVRFNDVNRFSTPDSTQKLTLFFSGLSNVAGGQDVDVELYKYFGTGGSPHTEIPTPLETVNLKYDAWSDHSISFNYGDNSNFVLGTNHNDYFAIRIKLPVAQVFDVQLTDFVLYVGDLTITERPYTTDPVPFGEGWVTDPTTDPALTNDLNATLANMWDPIDPTTGVVGTTDGLNGVLDNMYKYNTTDSEVLGGTQDLTTGLVVNTYKAFNNLSLDLQPGKYLISYSVSTFLRLGNAVSLERSASVRVQDITNATTCPESIAELYLERTVELNEGAISAACSGATFIIEVAAPLTIQAQVAITDITGIDSFEARYGTILAVRLGV